MNPEQATQGWKAHLSDAAGVALRDAARAFLDTKLEVNGLSGSTIYDYFSKSAQLSDPKLGATNAFFDHMGHGYNGYVERLTQQREDYIGTEKNFELIRFLAALEKIADQENRTYYERQCRQFPGFSAESQDSGNVFVEALTRPVEYLGKLSNIVDTHGVIAGERSGFLMNLESMMQCAINYMQADIDPDGSVARPADIQRMQAVGLPVITAMQDAYRMHLQPHFTKKGVGVDQ